MRQALLLTALLMAITGCSSESAADASMKAALMGSWYYQFNDPSERVVTGVVLMSEGGTYSGRERITGEPSEERTAGPWYVTEGLLKMNATERDGKKLGAADMQYRTCKVEKLTPNGFDCVAGQLGKTLQFKKVQRDHPLS